MERKPMRYKRLERFKKNRRRKIRRVLLIAVVMPLALAVLGYLLASLVILPSMSG